MATKMLEFRLDDVKRRLGLHGDEQAQAELEGHRGLMQGLETFAAEEREAKATIDGFRRAGLPAKADDVQKALDAKRKGFSERVAKARGGVEKLKGDLQATEDRVAAGLEETPHGWVAVKRPVPTTDQLAQRREIRDLARTLPRHELRERYLQAVRSGADPEFVAALEEAPRSFPLLDAPMVDTARRMRLEASPFAGAIERQRALLGAHELIVGAIEREAAGIGAIEPKAGSGPAAA